MKQSIRRDILLALDENNLEAITGFELISVLGDGQSNLSAANLLANLLELEELGLVVLDRKRRYLISLTDKGKDTAKELNLAKQTEAMLIMVDLVSFTTFTDNFGDVAAKDTIEVLMKLSKKLLTQHKSNLIKHLGDGFLAAGPSNLDILKLVRNIRSELSNQTSVKWQLHAACHVGMPIKYKSDYFGRDVNLVARLCELSGADELVFTDQVKVSEPGVISSFINIKGFKDAIAVSKLKI